MGAFVIFLLGAVFFIVMFSFVQRDSGNQDSQKKNSIYETMLARIGITSVSEETLLSVDNLAKEKVFSLLQKHKLNENLIHNTHSSWGICAFAHNCLVTSLEAHIVKPGYISKEELFSFFMDYVPDKNQAIVRKLFNYNDKILPEYGFETLKNEYTQHLDFVIRIVEEPIKITSGRVIKLNDIEYYKVEGTSQYVTDVKGGGANLAGAVYGGILAGGAGAIVGSQLGTNVKTDIVRKDDRKIFLYYRSNGILLNEEIITDNIDSILSLLRQWMPAKEYSYVIAQRNMNPVNDTQQALPYTEKKQIVEAAVNKQHSYSELKELKELLDLGIITQEEFDRKKKEVLGF